ncbi:hypothetical protein EPI10_002075 [Gossypium australe]|uniref:Mitochondrial protein n=1 Tax=Gossypium australe TaxID=47621 RepID=A0A5B6VDH8_9ROSI|nr:hypothetical protein EPI10_002075 [Gossypium australe]
MVRNGNLFFTEGDVFTDVREYQSITGALQYVVIIRPYIAFAVNRICQFMPSLLDLHFKVIKRILRYLKGTIDYCIMFKLASRLSIESFADGIVGSDIDDHHSSIGYCVIFGENHVSWCSKKQQVVSHSTTEAEYHNLAFAQLMLCSLSHYLWSSVFLWMISQQSGVTIQVRLLC